MRTFCFLVALYPRPIPLAILMLLLGLETGCLLCRRRLLGAATSLLGICDRIGVIAFLSWLHRASSGLRCTTGVHGMRGLSPVIAGQVEASEPADRLTRTISPALKCTGAATISLASQLSNFPPKLSSVAASYIGLAQDILSTTGSSK